MEEKNFSSKFALPLSLLFAALMVAAAWFFPAGSVQKSISSDLKSLEDRVLPTQGIELPVEWGDLGRKLVQEGVIDSKKFEALYAGRGRYGQTIQKLLLDTSNGRIVITPDNADLWLNLFWALGLSNKSAILEKGPMTDPRYGARGAGGFASTGGWTLSRGGAMEHYSRHAFLVLTPEEEALVERVSRNIYRPCCNNPTYFPDCNHGMAMLALLELLAAHGAKEAEMYKIALQVNAYWFPDTYLTVAKYLESKGRSWESADPKEILGENYSSASGYQLILSEVPPAQGTRGGGCGV